jgi:hypothetical protein
MDAEPSIQCDIPDGPHARMKAVAGLMMVLFGIGVPAMFASVLYYHRRSIVADQLLRQSGEGDTALTNPDIRVRHRFRKLYEDYKPEFMFWKLVLVCRKLCFALIVVLMSSNVAAQASLSVAVLFVSYLLQQRCSPYITLSALSSNLGLTSANLNLRVGLDSDQHLQLEVGIPVPVGGLAGAPRAARASLLALPGGATTTASAIASCTDSESESIRNRRRRSTMVKRNSESSNQCQRSSPSHTHGHFQVGLHAVNDSEVQVHQAGTSCATASSSGPPGNLNCLISTSTTRSTATATATGTGSSSTLNAPGSGWRHVLAAFMRAAVYTGKIDYNHLETTFLVIAITILLIGMVFFSRGFVPGSIGYMLLTAIAASIISLSTSAFVILLAFEVYRSLKVSTLDSYARQLEADKLEVVMRQRSKSTVRRRSSVTVLQLMEGNEHLGLSSSIRGLTTADSTSGYASRRRSSLMNSRALWRGSASVPGGPLLNVQEYR